MPTPISGTAYRQFVAAELPVGSVPRTPPGGGPGAAGSRAALRLRRRGEVARGVPHQGRKLGFLTRMVVESAGLRPFTGRGIWSLARAGCSAFASAR